ncbi:MAG: Carbamoyl-phosphate synthase large chain [Alphaproteobacteria bacterium MarineAlpha9_Bin3]|nr:MAG: Carbamoyl-phosphate synthase large chain [Alphaproteobacteria bacterium MarineAlpha9_Bin3]|tara:strand:+ start:4566 stop:7820 length:3255 start_codon:yes stop_codon:yes gene_type:complete
MPKRSDIKSILIIGAGPIVIGQACEFDYSGSQACKILREEGYRIILINSNPATIMTDPNFADATYIEPITPEMVTKIIITEKPDAILPTMGGQTALNTAMSLAESGILKKYNVELIGASLKAIKKAEDRELFKSAMKKIGLTTPKGILAENKKEADNALKEIGLPLIIRPSFTLGGTGGGIAYNKDEFDKIITGGLDASPVNSVLIEESIIGWKEYEMEVVRDKADNVIIICSIENIDPMGIHTGDSITVAPALTLTDKEYQMMRNASISILREIGVETGGSNVQFAINPEDGRMVVIEMNPRVSRSSALASKATGFPIAKVAARLSVGYTLDEIQNDITKSTPASFEPALDYVVTKIPRFAFEKFKGAQDTLTSAMKSVGETMAIGRTFQESFQKALRSIETDLDGFNNIKIPGYENGGDKSSISAALSRPTPERILYIAQAFREGFNLDEIFDCSKIDPWFLGQIKEIVEIEKAIELNGLPKNFDELHFIKSKGFSDKRIATLAKTKTKKIKSLRYKYKVKPIFKRIDSCAGEFNSKTPYLYSTYEDTNSKIYSNESEVTDRKKVIILGGGPNRIGQGIEFDYCCVHAAYSLSSKGYETIMINCNPETVSTDYDTSDRLYFEPLTEEDVLEIIENESLKGNLKGCIVQYGGQTPLKLAKALSKANIPIIGTSPDMIDLAEDRDRFQKLLKKLKLKQPPNGICNSASEAVNIAKKIGYPVLVRPSYVLGGRAMEIIHNEQSLNQYINSIISTFGKNPILIDRFLSDAIEVDVDVIADKNLSIVAGIMEHIEEAGVHSGDSACTIPPHSLPKSTINEIEKQSNTLAKALKVIGLMNIQFAIKDIELGKPKIYILEVNPRASRTVPFVAKATDNQFAGIAARVMAGEKLSSFKITPWYKTNKISVKEAVFPFGRFPGVDTLLGPEMKSTGEAMGLAKNFGQAFAKSQMAVGSNLPKSGTLFISVKDSDKIKILPLCKKLLGLGFKIIATKGTSKYLEENNIKVIRINKVSQGRPHLVDAIKDGLVNIIFNTTEGEQSIKESFSLRRAALSANIPYYTTLAGSKAATEAIISINKDELTVKPIQSY